MPAPWDKLRQPAVAPVANGLAEPVSTLLPLAPAADDYSDLKVRIHQRLLELLNLNLLDKTPRDVLRQEIRVVVRGLLSEEKRFLQVHQLEQLVEDVIDEILGLGPLEPLLKDPSITDILINT